MGEGYFLDIIFFAMVAAFIFLRLRSVLGRRTGHEQQRQEAYRLRQQQREGNVVSLPERAGRDRGAEPGADARAWGRDTPAEAGLTQIKMADPKFEPATFLDGARAAYDMIVQAFAAGDRDTLRSLLSEDVYDNFVGAIETREQAGQTLTTTITAIKSADIVEASLDGRIANVTVKFVSDMISVTKDGSGEIVGGEPRERETIDIWTFARDTGNRDPNWALVETRSEA